MEAAGLCMGRSEANAAKIALIGLHTKTCLDGVVVFVRERAAIGTRLIVGEDSGLVGSMEQPHLSHVAAGASRAAPHHDIIERILRDGKGRNGEDPQNHRHGKEQGKQFLHLGTPLFIFDSLLSVPTDEVKRSLSIIILQKVVAKCQCGMNCETAHSFLWKLYVLRSFLREWRPSPAAPDGAATSPERGRPWQRRNVRCL